MSVDEAVDPERAQRGGSPPPAAEVTAVLQALRSYGAAFADLSRDLGRRVGLHSTDAAALVEVLAAQDRGEPLTASQLAARVGLTGGATSSLLNRLEGAELLRRRRGTADRRVVTLHPSDGAEELVAGYFAPLARVLGPVIAAHSRRELVAVTAVLTEVTRLVQAHASASTFPLSVADPSTGPAEHGVHDPAPPRR